jgi:predicted dinucleotide-utilizing enzyme
LVGILVRPERVPHFRRKAAGRFTLVQGLAELLNLAPDIVVEAAGHDAVARYGADVLGRGIDLMIASVGALADRKLAQGLVAAAAGGAELWIASGAVAGIDGLLAACTAGLRSVTYTSLKVPAAWNGTSVQEALADETAKTRGGPGCGRAGTGPNRFAHYLYKDRSDSSCDTGPPSYRRQVRNSCSRWGAP